MRRTLAIATLLMTTLTACPRRSKPSGDEPVVEMKEGSGPLRDQLIAARTKAGTKTFLVMTTAGWCPPCVAFKKHLHDSEVEKVLAGTTLAVIDIDRFEKPELERCGYSASSVPWIMKVDTELRVVDAMSDEWDKSPTGANIAGVVDAFLKGTLMNRKYDWHSAEWGFPQPAN